jgi:pyridoxal 5'-phosphate synthase pdxT subunit
VKVGVVSLQGDVREHTEALLEADAEPVGVRRPEDLAGVEAVVIPGGESTTLSMLLESSGLTGPLTERLAAGIPVLGTCAGLILLASEVLDGRPDQRSFGVLDLTVRRNGFGRQLESFETDVEVRGLAGGPVRAVFIRAPVITRVGENVDVLATIPGAEGRESIPVVCRQGPVLATAFHPELTGDPRLHRLFLTVADSWQRRV